MRLDAVGASNQLTGVARLNGAASHQAPQALSHGACSASSLGCALPVCGVPVAGAQLFTHRLENGLRRGQQLLTA